MTATELFCTNVQCRPLFRFQFLEYLPLDIFWQNARFLEVQHQLNMAEKELEKKFSQTGAYKNLKKMLASKNETIKEMRRKLNAYEPDNACDDDKEED